MNEHKPCCDRCLPHTKLGECYNPSCPCHKPDEPKAWRERFADEFTKKGGRYGNSTYLIRHIPEIVDFIAQVEAETAQRARAEAIRECVAVLGQSDHPMIVAAIKALTDKLKQS